MTVEIKSVREYLDNLSEDRVHDEVVQKWIDMATVNVTNEKSEVATAETVDSAVLAIAGYQVYNAYASQVERTVGQVPPNMMMNLQIYKNFADLYLGYAKRGTVGGRPIIGVVKSLITEVQDGEYEV